MRPLATAPPDGQRLPAIRGQVRFVTQGQQVILKQTAINVVVFRDEHAQASRAAAESIGRIFGPEDYPIWYGNWPEYTPDVRRRGNLHPKGPRGYWHGR